MSTNLLGVAHRLGISLRTATGVVLACLAVGHAGLSNSAQQEVKFDRAEVRDGAIVLKDFIDSYEGDGWVAGTVAKVDKDSITVLVEKGKKKEHRARIDAKTILCMEKKVMQEALKAVKGLTVGHRVSVAFRKGTDLADSIVDQSYEIGTRLSSPTSGSSGGPSMPECD